MTDLKRLGPQLSKRYVYQGSILEQVIYRIHALRTKWRKQKNGPLRGSSVCGCICLEGSVLHRVCCKVYNRRPMVCRTAVKPGDRCCREIRKLYLDGIENPKDK
jgi:Fe-S-cluster containining protein